VKVAAAAVITILQTASVFAGVEWDFAAPHKSRCSEGSQLDMNICMSKEAAQVDQKLSNLLQRLKLTLRTPASALRAQAAWERFRTNECEFATSGLEKGESGYAFALYACRIDLAEKRIRDLSDHLEAICNGCPPRKEGE
jgi:Uncharacterized protein conserved in bacteria